VDVQVVNLLTAIVSGVHDNPEPAFGVRPATFLQRKLRDERHHSPEERFMLWPHLGHGRNMFLGHQEEMHGRPRIDVVEGHHLVVLVHLA
jgi:hypothetical protein